MVNSVDSDQMSHSAVPDLGLHCLLRPICLNTSGYYGNYSTSATDRPLRAVIVDLDQMVQNSVSDQRLLHCLAPVWQFFRQISR